MRRLLLVDDDDDICEVAQTVLEVLSDWEVVTAASGAEAVALAWGASFDAVVLDVMMPELDGPATLARLRSLPTTEATPVVLMTAATPDDSDRFDALDVAGLVSKPFDPTTLVGQLRGILAW